LLGHVELSTDTRQFRPPRAGSLLNLLWPSIAVDFERAFNPDQLQAASQSELGWLTPELRRFESAWSLPEFQGLTGAGTQEELVDNVAEVEFYWVGSEARIAGTLVHRWLQLVADKRVGLQAGEMGQIRSITERWLRGTGVSGEPAAAITARVEAALQGILGDEKGRWLLEGNGAAELALTGVYEGKITSVVLDRVRIDEQGVHWIVDYKTSSHEGGDLQSFLRAEIDRYKPQLQKYAQLYRDYCDADVRCALYFPLLQEFVPVPL
jgi:ATP-dependent exoDNAse (exonuclease V) beta subunit